MYEMPGLGRQMRKFLIDRKIEIDAAHRVHLHGSKCGQLHGHRYSVHAVCSGSLAEEGEEDGMVMDFGFLKEEMISVIDNCCDHGLILSESDPLLKIFLSKDCEHHSIIGPSGFSLISTSIAHGVSIGKIYIIKNTPTAENLAQHWFLRLAPRIKSKTNDRAVLERVIVFETPNCYASYPL
jgi:6-pyruvoyltetrahydropterin/6-carboxytetrahydropterin synthase